MSPTPTTQTQKPAPSGVTQKQTGGRPPGAPSRPAAETALETLQGRLNRATALLNDSPTASVAVAVARCAKVKVPRAKVDLALGALLAAYQDLVKAADAVYAAPAARDVEVRPRVNLAAPAAATPVQ